MNWFGYHRDICFGNRLETLHQKLNTTYRIFISAKQGIPLSKGHISHSRVMGEYVYFCNVRVEPA